MSTPAPARDGVVLGMSDRDYHRGPELSSTGARHILDSPARFAWRIEHPEYSDAMNFGRIVHLKVLGVGADVVEIPAEHLTPGGSLSTKAATKEWKAEQDAAGMTLMAPADLARANALVHAVLNHDGARRLLETPGDSEVSAFATDPDTGVRCRARFDRLGDAGAIDLKTTKGSASARGFGSACASFGYPIQEAFYYDVLHWATGHILDQPMQFIVVESAPPHFVAVRTIPEDARLIALDKVREARRIYADAAAADSWPSYPDGEAEMPSWWLYQNDTDLDVELKLA